MHQENGLTPSLKIDNCDKLPSEPSTLRASDDNKCVSDDKGAFKRHLDAKTRSSKYAQNDARANDNSSTNGRNMSVIISEESTVLIKVAPQNNDKVFQKRVFTRFILSLF